MSLTTYETVFIAEPEIPNDQVDQFIAKIKQIITANNGTLTGEDRWGRRRMAYAIGGHREGFYAVLNYTAEPGVVNTLEHLFNVTDSVIRHLTIRVIKKNKVFAPRRERSAVSPDSHGRGPSRSAAPARHRTVEPPKPTATTAEPAASAPAPAEGGTPA